MKKRKLAGLLAAALLAVMVLLPVQTYAAGWYQWGDDWYYELSDGSDATGWLAYNGKTYYLDAEGGWMYKGGPHEIQGSWYHFADNGALQTGWISDTYTSEDGGTYKEWYYAASDGVLVTEWEKIGGKWYYFDPEYLSMCSGTSYRISGKIYVFQNNGALVSTADWIKLNDGAWYYTKADGTAYTGWQKIGGKWYYLDPEWGYMVTGSRAINGVLYTFGSNGVLASTIKSNGWHTVGDSKYYIKDGKVVTGWEKIGGYWYYFDPDTGYMYSNVCEEIGGKLYFFQTNGKMATSAGWYKETYEDGIVFWYYLNSSGNIVTGWQKIGGEWYFFEDYGTMRTNAYAWDSSGEYWMGSDGKITRNKWIKDPDFGEWHYMKADGHAACNEWAKDSGGWYWMDSDGRIARYTWAKDSGGWYYMGSDGRISKNKWAEDENGWLYLGSDGRIVKNAWAKDSVGWMWMGSDGRITCDKWIKYGSDWYYVGSDGYMLTDEWKEDSSGLCYLDSSGKMAKSKWVKTGGVWHYVDAGGHMIVNGWAKDTYGWRWLNEWGEITRDQFITWYNPDPKYCRDCTYYLKSNGYMAVNEPVPSSPAGMSAGPDGVCGWG